MPLIKAKPMAYRWYCFKFFARLRAEAAGSTSKLFKIRRPTLEMLNVTTTAMATVNRVLAVLTGIPREEAS